MQDYSYPQAYAAWQAELRQSAATAAQARRAARERRSGPWTRARADRPG